MFSIACDRKMAVKITKRYPHISSEWLKQTNKKKNELTNDLTVGENVE